MKNVPRAFWNIVRVMDLASLFCVGRLFKAVVQFSLSRRIKYLPCQLGRSSGKVPGLSPRYREHTALGFRAGEPPLSCLLSCFPAWWNGAATWPSHQRTLRVGASELAAPVLSSCMPTDRSHVHSFTTQTFIVGYHTVGARSTAVRKEGKLPALKHQYIALSGQSGIKK